MGKVYFQLPRYCSQAAVIFCEIQRRNQQSFVHPGYFSQHNESSHLERRALEEVRSRHPE
jgi:hypothetical protein